MGWRDYLEAWEIDDLQALERQLKQGYCEDLEHERRKIINRGHQRATIANRRNRGDT
jgi:hypothetical protein